MKLSVKNNAKERQKDRKKALSFFQLFILPFVSQLAIVLEETKKRSWRKTKVFLTRGTVLPVSFASMYFPPMHKSKKQLLYGKGSARAELAEKWKMGICQVLDGHLLDQDRQPGSYRISAFCLGRNL